MSDLFEKLNSNINKLSNTVSIGGKKILQSLLLNGENLGRKGKTQLEIEKLKWKLKQKYNILGRYVYDQKISSSITDFSHNNHFLDLVNEINRIKLYIEELKNDIISSKAE